ncbi:Calx-beta domain-containing protein [Verrucomicrobiota bacterium sgz303538]
MLKSPLSARPVIEALEARIAPATFTVTTTADSGPGSLRQAILDANGLSGADMIRVDILGDQLQVIALTSPLPAITEKLSLMGVQSATTEQIRLDGTAAGADAAGLTITTSAADGSEIIGLQITNFGGSGILIDGTSSVAISNNKVFGNNLHGLHIKAGSYTRLEGNAFGIVASIPGSTGNKGDGILIENSTGTTIGDSSADYVRNPGNVIEGNGLFGIEIRASSSTTITRNTVTNNGTLALASDQGGGIAVIDSTATRIGAKIDFDPSYPNSWFTVGNSVSANHGNGILIKGQASTGTKVSGNEVNSNLLGDGIRIDGAVNTTFGEVQGHPTSRGYYEEIKGNTFYDNAGWGVAVVNGASNAVIRASSIAGNVAGAVLLDHASSSTVGGQEIYYAGYDTVTGGYWWETSRDGNRIRANSATSGVLVKDSSGIEIYGNTFIGTGGWIDLGGDGATANDPGDADAGPNHLQNYPTLFVSSGQLTGTLATEAANTKYRVQVYTLNQTTNELTLFSTQEVTTGTDGVASIVVNNSSISTSQKYFATATNLTTGETSEFSLAAGSKPNISITSASTTEGNSGSTNLTFTVTLETATTLQVKVGYRSSDNTAKAGEDYGAVEGVLVFEPGETTKTITVPVFGDPIKEAIESFFIQLANVENGVLSPTNSSVVGTIINDDGLPTISIQDVVTAEGANASTTRPGYTEVQYAVTLSDSSLDPVTVKLGVAGGTASVSSDYDPIDSTITFAPGATSVTKTLYIKNDTAREETETIQLQLSNPTAGNLGNANAIVSILDDDTWQIQADTVQIVEGNDGQSVAVMKVRLVNSYRVTDHTHPISVNFNTQNGTATAGTDYVTTQGTLTFQPGEIEKTISVPILGDNTAEQIENFSVKFSTPFGATLQQASQTVSLLNDDPGTISVASASITEGHGGQKILVFNVSMSVPTTSPVSVNFETQDGTALAGVDFETAAGQITFAPGETQKTISVPILGDRIAEQNEAFTLKLTGASGATIATATATGTILNDDPLISIESAQFLEGQPSIPGTHSVYLPVRLSQATDIPISVNFATSNGSAEASSDYIRTSGTLNFAAGQTLQYIELQIVGDLTFEPDETFSVKLSNPQGAQMGAETGVVIIKSDEPFISAQDVTIAEGHSGTKSLVFSVTLSQSQSSTVTVDYTTADGTATAGSDYTAVSGTLSFSPGETMKTVSVPISGDTVQEVDETLRLLLSNAVGVSVGKAGVLGTIANDDSPESLPVLSVANASVTEGHFGTSSLIFTFSLSKASASAVSLQYSTADGTATVGSDYTATFGTLTFAPGETTKTVSVTISGDQQVEANETLQLLLSGVNGAALGTTEATGFILNDDSTTPQALPTLSVQGGSVYEGYTGTKPLIFTVTLSEASAWPVSVSYSASSGTAYGSFLDPYADFLAASGSLTFAPGEMSKTVEVLIHGDEFREANETVLFSLSFPTGATLATTQTTGTILNDDLYGEDVGLIISKIGKGKHKAVWSENDGDLVTLISSQQISWLSFGFDAEGHTVVQKVSTIGDKPSSLQFTVQKSLTGDGKVNVDQIWTNADLTEVSIPGRLASIIAGDTKLKTPAIHKLTVDSFGLDPASVEAGAEPLQSKIKGSIGNFTVKGDFMGANLSVSGGSFGSLTIGGNLVGTSASTATGLYVEKGLNKLQVDGDIRGTDPAHPVIIRTAGFPDHPTETLHRAVIGGDVTNTNLLAGTESQVGIRVGDILVNGDWTASNLIIGAGAGPDGLPGTDDDIATQDTASRIARITIRGAISGTAETESGTDHFGFVAGRIAAFQVGAQKLALSSKWKDSMEVGSTFDVMLRELAGRSRA